MRALYFLYVRQYKIYCNSENFSLYNFSLCCNFYLNEEKRCKWKLGKTQRSFLWNAVAEYFALTRNRSILIQWQYLCLLILQYFYWILNILCIARNRPYSLQVSNCTRYMIIQSKYSNAKCLPSALQK